MRSIWPVLLLRTITARGVCRAGGSAAHRVLGQPNIQISSCGKFSWRPIFINCSYSHKPTPRDLQNPITPKAPEIRSLIKDTRCTIRNSSQTFYHKKKSLMVPIIFGKLLQIFSCDLHRTFCSRMINYTRTRRRVNSK